MKPDVGGEEDREIFRFHRHDPSQSSYRRKDAGNSGYNGGHCRSVRRSGGSGRILGERIDEDRRRKRRVPKHVHPGWSVKSVTDQTGGGVPARKGQRLQERERAAEYVTTCEREKGKLRLDRELSEKEGCRDKIDNAHDGLQNRNEGINSADLYARERCDSGRGGGQSDNDADRHRPLPVGRWHRRDH